MSFHRRTSPHTRKISHVTSKKFEGNEGLAASQRLIHCLSCCPCLPSPLAQSGDFWRGQWNGGRAGGQCDGGGGDEGEGNPGQAVRPPAQRQLLSVENEVNYSPLLITQYDACPLEDEPKNAPPPDLSREAPPFCSAVRASSGRMLSTKSHDHEMGPPRARGDFRVRALISPHQLQLSLVCGRAGAGAGGVTAGHFERGPSVARSSRRSLSFTNDAPNSG